MLPQRLVGPVQAFMECDCRVESAIVYSFSTAKIGGKRFTCGEMLCVDKKRCGSVVTMVSGGRSMCGLVKKFYRVVCSCDYFFDFAVVTWFPNPTYPDRDPLTVEINIGGVDVNNIDRVCVVPLKYLQPSRMAVEFDDRRPVMLMCRIDGADTSPTFN